MELRAPSPDPDAGPESPAGLMPVDPSQPVSWRVDRRVTVAKCAGAGIFGLGAVVGYPDPGQVIVVGIAAVLLAVLAVRDLVAPVRLAADPAGVTLTTGFAGRRRVPWAEVDRIRVDARRGLLVRSQVLELDAGDRLYFFGVNELGVPCDEVGTRLAAIRAAARAG